MYFNYSNEWYSELLVFKHTHISSELWASSTNAVRLISPCIPVYEDWQDWHVIKEYQDNTSPGNFSKSFCFPLLQYIIVAR